MEDYILYRAILLSQIYWNKIKIAFSVTNLSLAQKKKAIDLSAYR